MWFVYIMVAGDLSKIGQTSNVESRLANYKSHNPTVQLVRQLCVPNKWIALNIEFVVQNTLSSHVASGREWFRLPAERIVETMGAYLAEFAAMALAWNTPPCEDLPEVKAAPLPPSPPTPPELPF